MEKVSKANIEVPNIFIDVGSLKIISLLSLMELVLIYFMIGGRTYGSLSERVFDSGPPQPNISLGVI